MRPLHGVKILDFTTNHGGVASTLQLADFGAEVIKVERPGSGDAARFWPPLKGDISAYFSFLNRGKKSITVDIRTEEGKEIIKRLVKKVDVVCENFKVGTMEKSGLGYEVLKEINPSIIYASISGFGQTGPLKNYPAYDIAIQAMSGFMDVTGFQDGPPTKTGPAVGDWFSGTYLSIGICMALYHREITGEGQKIDVSMVDSLISALEDKPIHYSLANVQPVRVGNAHPMIAPYDVFQTRDGYFAIGVSTDDQWEKFCQSMEMTEFIDDPRFNTNEERGKNYFSDLRDIIEAKTKTMTKDELDARMAEAKIPVGPVCTIVEAVHNPQLEAREMLVKVHDAALGDITMPGTPIKMYGTSAIISEGGPILGANTDEVLKKLGYSDQDILELHQNSIV